jgi:hypothetical protein
MQAVAVVQLQRLAALVEMVVVVTEDKVILRMVLPEQQILEAVAVEHAVVLAYQVLVDLV